jgi:GNAT superfamily N-acetyltransferase
MGSARLRAPKLRVSDVAVPPRKAIVADARAIAKVHVQSWRETYADIVPAAEIAKRTVDVRERQWREWLAAGKNDIFVIGDPVIGFAAAGEPRAPLAAESELYAIYLLRAHQGRGVGRALFDACADAMRQRGARTMALWVLARNPRACAFYERVGGRIVATRIDEMGLEERAFEFAL